MENFTLKDGEWAYCVLDILHTQPELATEKISIQPGSYSVLDPDAIFLLNDDENSIECNFGQIDEGIAVKYGFLEEEEDDEENEFYDLDDEELQDAMNKIIKYCQKLKSPQTELEKNLFKESKLSWDKYYK